MQTITRLDELEAKIAECNDVLTHQSDDAMRQFFGTFRLDLSEQAPADPFGDAYRAYQMSIYRTVSGRPYAVANERSNFDIAGKIAAPFPYYLQSASTAGHYFLAVAFMLCKLQLPPRARILEFGPGWGHTTIELARLGFEMTAIDIDSNFCEVIRARARQLDLDIEVIEGEFFLAETVRRPYDAVLFFECFHHCDDHLRLLRALHRAVVPGGRVYLAAEPISAGFGRPWGVRLDGEALWAARNFGWLELGFDEGYFRQALAATGWRGTMHTCETVPWASVWELERLQDPASAGTVPETVPEIVAAAEPPPEPPVEAAPPVAPPLEMALAKARAELDAMRRSTSWRVTGPLRQAARLLRRRRTRPGFVNRR